MDAVVGSPTRISVPSDAGIELEAEYHLPKGASAMVVLSHPHPVYGGDMFNPLIADLFRALPAAGIAALRYNFRGAGGSTGSHDEGMGERNDAAAAFTAATDLGLSGPLVSAGWSFGADVSLAADNAALAGWVAIAAPLQIVAPDEMVAPQDPRPKLLIVPERDQFRDPDSAAEVVAGWATTDLQTVTGADHFLMGHSAPVAQLVQGFVEGL